MMQLSNKIIARENLLESVNLIRRPIVLTNGVFDLLHPGHVQYLEAARLLGAALVVGVNSDRSARSLGKGLGRPINGEADRAIMLAALESVSLVTIFEERTPVELVRQVRPEVYVKGGDYDVQELEEAILVRSWGGRTQTLQFVEGHSTTLLVDRIRSLGS